MPPLLPRFHRFQQEREDLRKIAAVILEGSEVEPQTGMPLRSSADGHRSDRRRGVPLIGRGVTGGVNPLSVLIAKERRAGR